MFFPPSLVTALVYNPGQSSWHTDIWHLAYLFSKLSIARRPIIQNTLFLIIRVLDTQFSSVMHFYVYLKAEYLRLYVAMWVDGWILLMENSMDVMCLTRYCSILLCWSFPWPIKSKAPSGVDKLLTNMTFGMSFLLRGLWCSLSNREVHTNGPFDSRCRPKQAQCGPCQNVIYTP